MEVSAGGLQSNKALESAMTVCVCASYVQAGVVGENSVVAQRHVLLLPLLVQGFSASLQQHALQETTTATLRLCVSSFHQ